MAKATGFLRRGASFLRGAPTKFKTAVIAFLLTGQAAMACELPDTRTDVRPGPPDRPTEVSTSIGVFDLMGVEDVSQQLDIDFSVTLRWQDERLVGLEGCRFNITDVWRPRAVLMNSSNLRTLNRNALNEVAVGEDGWVTYRQRFTGLVSSYHNLRDFPFDRHNMHINFGSLTQSADQLVFVPDLEQTFIAQRLNIAGWDVRGISLSAAPVQLQRVDIETSLLTLSLDVHRMPDFYVYRVLLLLGFVVGMSWVVFWVPPSRFEFQIGIGATSMLTAIAFNLAVSGRLPPVGYLTALDKFVIWAILLVFLTIIEALITGRLVLAGHQQTALRIDRACRVIFPSLLFAGWAAILWVD